MLFHIILSKSKYIYINKFFNKEINTKFSCIKLYKIILKLFSYQSIPSQSILNFYHVLQATREIPFL